MDIIGFAYAGLVAAGGIMGKFVQNLDQTESFLFATLLLTKKIMTSQIINVN